MELKKYDNYKDSGIEWIGEIPNDWEVILFKRVIEKIKDGTHGSFQRVSVGHPFLSAKNVHDDGVRISETESYISEEDFSAITKNGFPKKNDLLITCVGTIGRTFVYDFENSMAFQRSVTFIRFNDGINPQFYKYYVQSSLYQNLLISLAKTSAQSGVYMNDLMNSTTLKLPVKYQNSIANYLDHKTTQIDQLTTQKQQLIALLQEERTAVINQAVTKGLDPAVKMKDSGIEWLGEIPEHWEVKKLKYICNLVNERANEKPEYIIALENISNWTGEIIGNPFQNKMEGDAILFQQNDILFNKLRPYLAKVLKTERNGGCVGELLVIRARKEIDSDFLYQRLSSEMIITIVDNSTYGTKMPRASWDKFISLIEIGVPSISEQKEIAIFIKNKISDIKRLISKTQQ
jgi:type I restriction enzyme S subunit